MIVLVVGMLTACGKSEATKIQEYLNLGQKYLAEANYEEAIVSLKNIIEINPKIMEAYTGLVESFYGKQDYDAMTNWINSGCEQLESIEVDTDLTSFLDVSIFDILNSSVATDNLILVESLYKKYDAMDHEAFMSRKDEIDKMIQKQTGFLIFDLEGELLSQIQDLYEANQLDELAETCISNQGILKNRNDYADMIVYFGECRGFLPEGFGIAIYGKNVKEKSVLYAGNWKHGKREGSGYDLLQDSAAREYGYYIGEWKNDLPDGEAKTHIKNASGTVTEYIGTANNGYAEGVFRAIFIGRDTNISGYEYNCIDGVPQSQGTGEVNQGELTEDIMSFLINPDGSKEAIWHAWAGLRCKDCHDDGSLDFLNTFDHKWAGWGETIKKYDYDVD